MTLTVTGSLESGDFDGNLRAVVLALLLVLLIVLLRRFEGTDAVLALCSAGVLVFVAALGAADPLGATADQFRLIVFFGLVFACCPRGHPIGRRALQSSNYNRPRRCHRPLQTTRFPSFPRRPSCSDSAAAESPAAGCDLPARRAAGQLKGWQ